VTADEIAHAAGVSVGTFYSYFSDKRDLFLAVLDDYFRQCDTLVFKAVDATASVGKNNAPSLIMEMISLLVSVHRAASPLLNEFLKMSLADEEVRRQLDDVDARIMSLIEGALIQAGVGKERATAAAFVLYHAGEGIIHQIALGRQEIDEEAVLTELTRLYTAYVMDAV
jgi:AcrR family transcriptional regulator